MVSETEQKGLNEAFQRILRGVGGMSNGTSISFKEIVQEYAGGFTSGAAATAGTATLVAGTVTIPTTAVSATSKIFFVHRGTGTIANFGILYRGATVAGVSFDIVSTNVADNDQVDWHIVQTV